MTKLIFYDKENDILSLHKTLKSDEKFKGNMDAGQLILDISTKGRVIGIEVMDASNFFKEFNITNKVLENLSAADFNVRIAPNGIIVGIVFKSKNLEQDMPAKIVIPSPQER
jgi:uncharacterized protein YuzE